MGAHAGRGWLLHRIHGIRWVPTTDELLVLARRDRCDEFRSVDEIFARLAARGVVDPFCNSASYLWSPRLLYIARGGWRKLPSEVFKPVPLVAAPLVEAVLQDGFLDAFMQLDEAMGADGRRIAEMAVAACGDREVVPRLCRVCAASG